MLRVLVALVALLAASSSAAFINEDFGRGPAFEHLRKDLRSASSISTRGAGSAEVVGLASQLNRQARDEHHDATEHRVVNVEYREKPLRASRAQWANVTAVFLRPRILGNICHMMNENILPLLEVLNGTTSPVELFTFPGHQVRARVRVRAG